MVQKKPAQLLPITWKTLHEDIFSRLKEEFSSQHNAFLKEIIPDDLFYEMFVVKSGKTSGNIDLRYTGYVYSAIDDASKRGLTKRFTVAREFILNAKSASGEAFRYDTLPVTLHFQKRWEDLLPESQFTAASDLPEAKALQRTVDDLLAALPEETLQIRARLTALCKDRPYSLVLAILSVIATTLFCFNKPLCSDDYVLHSKVLPPLPQLQASDALQFGRQAIADPGISFSSMYQKLTRLLSSPGETGEAQFLLYKKATQCGLAEKAKHYLRGSAIAGYLPALRQFYQNHYEKDWQRALLIFHGKQQADLPSITKCCSTCEEILRHEPFFPKEICGEASFILYFYISEGKYTSPTGVSAETFLEASHRFGHPAANAPWEKLKLRTSSILPKVTRAASPEAGICYANTANAFTAAFEKTLPASWAQTLAPLNPAELEAAMDSPIPRRFLLLDHDFSKNLEDLFRLLQLVKDAAPDPEQLRWEIFIRHDSENIHTLVDTALVRIPQYRIPVYILNDSKIAAQQLLSQHPLFYPVRLLNLKPQKAADCPRPLLHFVILGNTKVTEWLVREAFWMLGFRNNAIQTKITVLAKDGEAFERQLKGRFPGMVRSGIQIEGLELPEICGEDMDLESYALADRIGDILLETPYCYFAAATDSDDRNLALATRIREFLIRAAITGKDKERLYQMPPVAFFCRSDQIAWLSKSMCIETEQAGHRWFNTRALIPFGEISNRYSFDSITGGTFDLLAKCIHFQYSQLSPEENRQQTPYAISTEKAFYARQYNQDSSYSSALSMPYRLFQFSGIDSMQIFPTAWDILESSTFASVEQLKKLSARLLPNDRDSNEVAEWEHNRWMRWVLSRGWLPASFEDAIFAYDCGNPRQQLFACKIHPCICSYPDLKKLQDTLRAECGLKKDFYTYDLNNIKDTRRLLALEWVLPQEC